MSDFIDLFAIVCYLCMMFLDSFFGPCKLVTEAVLVNKFKFLRKIFVLLLFFSNQIFSQIPGFLPNKGQVYDQYGHANNGVRYLYRQGPLQFQLRDKGFSYEIFRKKEKTENDWDITRLDLAMQYAGQASPLQFDWHGEAELDDVSHYYNHLGRFENLRRARKVTGVSKDKNVKLVFEVSADGKVKYDIWVKPSVARSLRLSGHEQSRLLASNRPDKVSFIFFDDTIEESIPKVALMRNGVEAAIADAGWAQAENEQILRIVLPEGTSWREADWVVIDPLPVLRWATYYGGSSNDQGYGSAATPDGEVVYCGKSASTNSNVIASSGAYKTTNSGSDDAFIVKMKRNGGSGQRVWGTYFGGTLADAAYDVAVDLNGDVLVAGVTNSSGLGFNARYKSTYAANKDAIIIKFNASGNLQWCNYLGGSGDDEGLGITTDSSNNVIVVGKTESSGLNSNAGGYTVHQTTNAGVGDGFIAKLDKDGNRFFVTYYGGAASDELKGVVTSRKDTIVVVGTTSSSTGITSGGTFQGASYSNLNDAFIVKLTATGARVQSRYYGDLQDDYGYNVYYKSSNYFIVGKTNSDKNISTTGAHQTLLNSTSTVSTNTDGFMVKLSPNFNRLWATYYGGRDNDGASSMVIDDFDYVYLCGIFSCSKRP